MSPKDLMYKLRLGEKERLQLDAVAEHFGVPAAQLVRAWIGTAYAKLPTKAQTVSVSGALPTFFKAHALQARHSRNWEAAGYHLSIHAYDLVTQDVEREIADPMFQEANEATDPVRAFEQLFRRCLPRCMALVPENSKTFADGVVRAFEENKIF